MKLWKASTVGLAVALTVFVLWSQLGKGSQEAAVASPAGPSVRSGPRVVEPRTVVVRHEVAAVETVNGPSEGTSEDAAPTEEAEDEPLSDMERKAWLDFEFEADPRTVEGRQLEAKVRRSFEAPDVHGVRVDSLECRDSRCKVVVEFDNPEADRRVMEQVFGARNTEFNLAGSVPERLLEPDGSVRATIYLFPGAVRYQ